MIRLLGIFTRGIQYDDAFSILLAGRTIPQIFSGTAADTMPPLYYLILHFWQMLGNSVAFQRLPGIIFSLLILILVFVMVQRFAGRTAAIWATAMLAVSPLQYYHAQDIRMYSMVTFFILMWDYKALSIIYSETSGKWQWRDWIIIILCGTAALYSHALAGFGLLVPFIYLLLKREWKKLIHFGIAGIIVLSLYFPWMMLVPGQIAKVSHAFWTPLPGVVEIFQSLILILGDMPVPSVVLGIVLFCSLTVTIVCIFLASRSAFKSSFGLFAILMTIVPPAALFILSYVFIPVFVPRAFLSAYVGTAILIGLGVLKARRVELALVGGCILISSVLTLPFQIGMESFPRSPFRLAADFLQSEVRSMDIVLHDNKLSYFPFKIYAPDLKSRFLADPPGTANDTLAQETMDALSISAYSNLSSAIQGSDRVFFVVFERTLNEYQTQNGHPVVAELSRISGKPVQQTFGDLQIMEFNLSQVKP